MFSLKAKAWMKVCGWGKGIAATYYKVKRILQKIQQACSHCSVKVGKRIKNLNCSRVAAFDPGSHSILLKKLASHSLDRWWSSPSLEVYKDTSADLVVFSHRLDSMISNLFRANWFCKILAKTWQTYSYWWYKQMSITGCGVQSETKYSVRQSWRRNILVHPTRTGNCTSKSRRVLCQLTWEWHIAHQQIGLLGDQQGRELAKQDPLVHMVLIFGVPLNYCMNLFRIGDGSK